MAKQLDKDMMRMMSVTERFKYMNDLKKMRMNMSELTNDDPNEVGGDIMDWEEDDDVVEFLNDPANNKEPNEMGDTHEYIKGGLTHDADESFKAFQNKINKINKIKQSDEWVDREESEYDSSSDGSNSSDDGYSDGEDSNEY